MNRTILVTGATGNLGGEVVGTLLGGDYAVRAGRRSMKIGPAEALPAVKLDHTDPRRRTGKRCGVLRAGYAEVVTGDVEAIASRRTETFAGFVKRSIACWE